MASDLYLIRKDRRFAKYSDIEALDVTGAQLVYQKVTGVASSDTIGIPGNILQNDYGIVFTQLEGGAGLELNQTYYVINQSGSVFQVSLTQGGPAVTFTTDILSGTVVYNSNSILVYSSEFRDIFGGTSPFTIMDLYGPPDDKVGYHKEYTSVPGFGVYPTSPLITTGWPTGDAGAGTAFEVAIQGTTVASTGSDEVFHAPLRQTALNRTHWRFKQAGVVVPQYLFATWADGDIIANNPPNTP